MSSTDLDHKDYVAAVAAAKVGISSIVMFAHSVKILSIAAAAGAVLYGYNTLAKRYSN